MAHFFEIDNTIPLPTVRVSQRFAEPSGFGYGRFAAKRQLQEAHVNEKTLRALVTVAGGETETFADLLRAGAKNPKQP
jgi:hypothetical protein